VPLLRPLRDRDFALLWAGMTVSLLGDGVYLVAIAWQVYDLTGSPAALSLVGLAWSLGMVALLLLGGAVADRVDRRVQMVGADVLRLLAVAAMGVLAVTGAVEVWHLVALSLVFGIGEAFFAPAFSAFIPQVVKHDDLVQANALQQVVRPAAFRLAGPALGGLLVAAFGAGTAFLVDAGTFAVAIGCVLAIRVRPSAVAGAVEDLADGVLEGLAWARREPWFWASLAMTALGIMATLGPLEVLLPYVVRRELGGSASAFGLVLAAGGVGGILGALLVSRAGMPTRPLRFMYLWWALAAFVIAAYAVATAVWQLAALTFVYGVGMSSGIVIWGTLMQTRVPNRVLGRVSALDWAISIGLSPVSFALTGPIAAAAGADATLLGGGLLGGILTLAIYLGVPQVRADDARTATSAQRGEVVQEAGVADGGGVHADDLDPLARR
jgi:predicted MFS family arabinose efflux permease